MSNKAEPLPSEPANRASEAPNRTSEPANSASEAANRASEPDNRASEAANRAGEPANRGGNSADETRSLSEGEDYYWEGPYMVFTAAFLLRRGYCCDSGCRHCPYE